MKRRRIVVIEAISSSVNYISDIRNMGYEPVLMELWVPDTRKEFMRKWHDNYYSLNDDSMPDILQGFETYEENLELMKKLNPLLIIPGSDDAVVIAAKLSADLGLPGNNPENAYSMVEKYSMQIALKKAGLRYIDTAVINDAGDAVKFFHEKNDKPVIVKKKCGGGSIGVTLCMTEEDVIKAVEMHRIFFDNGDISGKVIVQEYIDGTEYAVDTVSSGGKHRTLFSYVYEKQILDGSRKLYDIDRYIDSGDEEYRFLSDYAFKVLDAIGVSYGPVHSQIMVDEFGPVLIEVNCRPAGTSVKSSYRDRIVGCHETGESLDAYLDSEKFENKIKEYGRYGHLICPAMVKNMIMPETVFVKHLKYNETAGKLKSFVYMLTNGENHIYEKTIDLCNQAGMIFLANEDVDQLKKDCDYLKDLEKNHMDALYDFEKIQNSEECE